MTNYPKNKGFKRTLPFCEYMGELRPMKNISLEEMSVRSGLSIETIKKLERAMTVPELDDVLAYCHGLGMEFEDVAAYTDKRVAEYTEECKERERRLAEKTK